MGINQGDVIDVGDNAPALSHREAIGVRFRPIGQDHRTHAVLVKVPIDLGHGVTTRLRAFSPQRAYNE
jgi:hypothetical protein